MSITKVGTADAMSLWRANINAGLTRLDKATLNALEYGAVGDGVTNDGAALQLALDAAASTGQPLYIPAGTYLITSALNFNVALDGNVIFGAGEGSTVIQQNTAIEHGLVYTATGDVSGFSLADISFVGADGAGNGIQIAANANTNARLLFSNVLARGWNYAINLLDTDQCNFICCNFRESTTGVHIDESLSVANAISFQSCIINDNAEYGFHIEAGRGVGINECDIGSGATAGINLIRWEGQKGEVRNCNFEFHAGNTLTYGVELNNAGSSLVVDGCFFNGFSTSTVVPVKVNVNNIATLTSNATAHAANIPLAEATITNTNVAGLSPKTPTTATAMSQGSISADGEALIIGPFPHIANATVFTPSIGNRTLTLWKAGNNWSSSDDLQASIEKTDGAGVATYKKTSLLNDNIITPLEDWVTANPVISTDNVATVAAAIEALQTVINNMGL